MNDPTNETSTGQTQSNAAQTIDYDALAHQAGAIDSAKASAPEKDWMPSHGDPVAHIKTSDGSEFHIHGDDLAEAQRRDPNLKVLAHPAPYQPDYDALARQAGAIQPPASLTPEQARSRTLMNMTRAMSGQAMDNAEDQAEAEKGREAGTIAGGLQILGGAAGGLLTRGVQVAQETSSLLGPEGQPIIKEVVKKAPSAAGKVIEAVKDALPKEATMEQAMKIGRIVYHLGLGTGGAAFLWHELFGK